jgi:hypothetical protein
VNSVGFTGAVAGLVTVALAGAGSAVAGAQELNPTAQAVAAHGEFLAQAPPPPTAGVLCLVDSGVDVNPDTQPGLAGRTSLFGGTGDDVTAYHHGTYVAMVAGAAANGWGMVGAWPGLRVLSIRALTETSDRLLGDAYRDGILRCVQAKTVSGVDVQAIELALGGSPALRSAGELAEVQEAVSRARQRGIVLVSAAGNDGGPVNMPASLTDVVAVAAADATGGLCRFSSRGPEVDLDALGCGMDVATTPEGASGVGQSTSLASAYVAGVLVALRSYRPDLTPAGAEALLLDTATLASGGRLLNASAAFRAAGLGALVDAYRPPAVGPPASACDARRRVCARPRAVRVTRHGRRLTIRLAAVPRGAVVMVSVDGHRRLRTRARTLRLRVRHFRRIAIRFTARGRQPSAAAIIHPSDVRR